MSKRVHPYLPQNDYDLTADGLTVLPLTVSYAHDQKYGLEIRFPNLISFKK